MVVKQETERCLLSLVTKRLAVETSVEWWQESQIAVGRRGGEEWR